MVKLGYPPVNYDASMPFPMPRFTQGKRSMAVKCLKSLEEENARLINQLSGHCHLATKALHGVRLANCPYRESMTVFGNSVAILHSVPPFGSASALRCEWLLMTS